MVKLFNFRTESSFLAGGLEIYRRVETVDQLQISSLELFFSIQCLVWFGRVI